MADPHERDENGVVVTKNTSNPVKPGEPEEVEAVTGRPATVAPPNSTFASRKAARLAAEGGDAEADEKAVSSGSAENKAVKSARSKAKA